MECEQCTYYIFDEEYQEYLCTLSLDEDEMLRFYSNLKANCPYFKSGDEYAIVRKQN